MNGGGETTGSRVPASFPTTHWTLVAIASNRSHPEWESRVSQLAQMYWKPVCQYLRLRWGKSDADAKDLTQEFFEGILEGRHLPQNDTERARFRTFVRTCVDNLVKHVHRDTRRLRRGGGKVILRLDLEEEVPVEPVSGMLSPEEILDRQWRDAILKEAILRLESFYIEKDRKILFDVFCRYDLASSAAERPSYEKLAGEFGITVAGVENNLKQARQRLYEIGRDLVRETVSTEGALEDELRDLFARESPRA